MELQSGEERVKNRKSLKRSEFSIWFVLFIFIIFGLVIVLVGFLISRDVQIQENQPQHQLPENWQALTLNQRIILNPNNCDLQIASDGFYSTQEIMWADGSCHPANKASVLDWSYVEHCQATLVSPVHYRSFSFFNQWMDYRIVSTDGDWLPQEPYAADICNSQALIRTVRDKNALANSLSQYYVLDDHKVVETYLAGDFWLDYFKNCYEDVETEEELTQDSWQARVAGSNYFLVSCNNKILGAEFLSLDDRRLKAQEDFQQTQNTSDIRVEEALKLYCSPNPTTEVEIYICPRT